MSADVVIDHDLVRAPFPDEIITTAQPWLDRFHDERSPVRRPSRGSSRTRPAGPTTA